LLFAGSERSFPPTLSHLAFLPVKHPGVLLLFWMMAGGDNRLQAINRQYASL